MHLLENNYCENNICFIMINLKKKRRRGPQVI